MIYAHADMHSNSELISPILLVHFQEEKTGENSKEAKTIKLYMQLPPIEKLDATLSTLVCCE